MSDKKVAEASSSLDDLSQHRSVLKEIREKILCVRRQLKSANKQQRKNILEEIRKLEEQETRMQNQVDADNKQAEKAEQATKIQAKSEAWALSKAKKQAKEAQAAAKREEAFAAAAKMPNLRKIESEAFEKVLFADSLCIHDIDPDGDCLFAAISHQLKVRQGKILGPKELRILAAEHVLANANTYSGFIDEGNSLEAYCERLRNSDLWGGHLEIDALVNVLGVTLRVYQADGPPICFAHPSSNYEGPPLTICFQKHAYSLGEHYDSLVDRASDL